MGGNRAPTDRALTEGRDPGVLRDTRRQRLLTELNERRSVGLTELAECLGVSEVTARRDLAALEKQGLLRRVRGGAVLPQSGEPPFPFRRTSQSEEKADIAAAALAYVRDGDTIAVDVGTTTLAFASLLSERDDLTVLTPSLHVVAVLAEHDTIRLIVPGGVVRSNERSLVGDLTIRTVGEFNVRQLFLGVGGVDPQRGLTEYQPDDAAVKRAMLASAREITVLADATKLRRVALANVAGLDAIDRLITDASASQETLSAVEQLGVEVVIAPPQGGAAEQRDHAGYEPFGDASDAPSIKTLDRPLGRPRADPQGDHA